MPGSYYNRKIMRQLQDKMKWADDAVPTDLYIPDWGLVSEKGLPPNDHPFMVDLMKGE